MSSYHSNRWKHVFQLKNCSVYLFEISVIFRLNSALSTCQKQTKRKIFIYSRKFDKNWFENLNHLHPKSLQQLTNTTFSHLHNSALNSNRFSTLTIPYININEQTACTLQSKCKTLNNYIILTASTMIVPTIDSPHYPRREKKFTISQICILQQSREREKDPVSETSLRAARAREKSKCVSADLDRSPDVRGVLRMRASERDATRIIRREFRECYTELSRFPFL